MLSRLIKILHELGAAGVIGAFVADLVLIMHAPTDSLVGYAETRRNIALLSQWLLVPSLALTLISGLLSIAATEAYKNAGWAWTKALLGISMFEGTLLTVVASGRRAAELSALAAAGNPDPAQLAEALRTERGGIWVLLTVAFLNVVLGVWRPRISRLVRITENTD